MHDFFHRYPAACSWYAARNAAGPRPGKATGTGCAMGQGRWRSGPCWFLLSCAFTHLAQRHGLRPRMPAVFSEASYILIRGGEPLAHHVSTSGVTHTLTHLRPTLTTRNG